MAKTVNIESFRFSTDMTSIFVMYHVADDVLNTTTPKDKTYESWTTTKTIDTTKSDIQADLESDEGI